MVLLPMQMDGLGSPSQHHGGGARIQPHRARRVRTARMRCEHAKSQSSCPNSGPVELIHGARLASTGNWVIQRTATSRKGMPAAEACDNATRGRGSQELA